MMLHRQGVQEPNARRVTALGHSTAPEPSISLVASLALLAVAVAWLATVPRWSSGSLVVDQSYGATLYRFVASDSRLDRILRLLSLFLFLAAGLLGALDLRRPRLPRPVVFLLAAMIVYNTLWCLVSYVGADYWPDIIGVYSPMMLSMCLGVFAGFDRSLWRWLRPVALSIAYSSLAVGAYYTVRLSIKGRFEGANPTVEHLQIAFWLSLCALVLRKSSCWRDSVPALIPLAGCLLMAVVIGSRSFALLAIVALAIGFMVLLQHRIRLIAVRVLALGVLTALVVGGIFWLLSAVAPGSLEALRNRLTADTRSSQYSQFFQQVPVLSLIRGVGPKATYAFNDWPKYEYLDNQLLFILFKFGLPALLGYCAVALWPGLRLLIRPDNQEQRLIGMLFALWTLAALGVSIFHSIVINPQNLVIVLLAGGAFAFKARRFKAAGRLGGSACYPRRVNVPRTMSVN